MMGAMKWPSKAPGLLSTLRATCPITCGFSVRLLAEPYRKPYGSAHRLRRTQPTVGLPCPRRSMISKRAARTDTRIQHLDSRPLGTVIGRRAIPKTPCDVDRRFRTVWYSTRTAQTAVRYSIRSHRSLLAAFATRALCRAVSVGLMPLHYRFSPGARCRGG